MSLLYVYLRTNGSELTWGRLSDYSVQLNEFQKHVSSPWLIHMLFRCLFTVKKMVYENNTEQNYSHKVGM